MRAGLQSRAISTSPVVVPDDVDLRKTYLDIVLKLQDAVGEDSYLLDVHVIRKRDVEKLLYTW